MTNDEIVRMAREAGFTDYYPERLTRFAALVAAHEREKQAKQEPVGYLFNQAAVEGNGWVKQVNVFCSVDPTLIPLKGACDVRPVYATPVRTKDLTDAELNTLWHNTKGGWLGLFRAVIAADRRKNK